MVRKRTSPVNGTLGRDSVLFAKGERSCAEGGAAAVEALKAVSFHAGVTCSGRKEFSYSWHL